MQWTVKENLRQEYMRKCLRSLPSLYNDGGERGSTLSLVRFCYYYCTVKVVLIYVALTSKPDLHGRADTVGS